MSIKTFDRLTAVLLLAAVSAFVLHYNVVLPHVDASMLHVSLPDLTLPVFRNI